MVSWISLVLTSVLQSSRIPLKSAFASASLNKTANKLMMHSTINVLVQLLQKKMQLKLVYAIFKIEQHS